MKDNQKRIDRIKRCLKDARNYTLPEQIGRLGHGVALDRIDTLMVEATSVLKALEGALKEEEVGS